MPYIIGQNDEHVKLAELHSLGDAAKLLGLNIWQLQYRLNTGKLEAVWLPNGKRAVTRAAIERYRREKK